MKNGGDLTTEGVGLKLFGPLSIFDPVDSNSLFRNYDVEEVLGSLSNSTNASLHDNDWLCIELYGRSMSSRYQQNQIIV